MKGKEIKRREEETKALMFLRYFYLLNFSIFAFSSSDLRNIVATDGCEKETNEILIKSCKNPFPGIKPFRNKKFSRLDELRPRNSSKRDRNENKLAREEKKRSNIYCNLQFVKHFITSNEFLWWIAGFLCLLLVSIMKMLSDQLCLLVEKLERSNGCLKSN